MAVPNQFGVEDLTCHISSGGLGGRIFEAHELQGLRSSKRAKTKDVCDRLRRRTQTQPINTLYQYKQQNMLQTIAMS